MFTNPEYRPLFAVDVERSSGRGNVAMMRYQEALFAQLREAFAASRIDWNACHREDLGDGVLVIAPQGVAKSSLIHPLAADLAGRLRSYNRTAGDSTKIRVRMALHAGDVHVHDGRIVGRPLEVLARLLDAPPGRAALQAAPASATVLLIVSQHVYDETVQHGYPGIDPETFTKVHFTVKETTGDAWLHLPGHHVEVPVGSSVADVLAGNPANVQHNTVTGSGVMFNNQSGSQHIYGRDTR
jgi:hypothetical protein